MQSQQIVDTIRAQVSGIENTSIVSMDGGFQMSSNTGAFLAGVRLDRSLFTVLIPMEHAATLVELVVQGRPYTRFLNDVLHWYPTSHPSGMNVLVLHRPRRCITNNMLDRLGRLIRRVIRRYAALEALAGAAMELADEIQALADAA
jgi:hypothetical protein